MLAPTLILLASLHDAPPPPPPDPVRVVTSVSTYAAIAREIVGDRGTVASIAGGDENVHFVQPKPSFVPLLARADVLVATGLDLELWLPALLDKAANPRVSEGGPGYVAAYPGVPLLDVPVSLSRAEGDIHIYGNPHIWTDPLNAVLIGRNILAGLTRVAPGDAEYFAARARDFEERIYQALYGEELVRLLGGATLADLDRQGKLFDFLSAERYRGTPLLDRLGGWHGRARVFRGREVACYHKEWDYFSRRFDVTCFDYVEPKPGIPPTPRHVQQLITRMRERGIRVLLASNYFDRQQVRQVAERTGAQAVIVATNVGGEPGVNTYFDLVDRWITAIAEAFAAAQRS
jgi:ABC-type Zn uptake system ZnuABC Zn-binding protein ZnuA